MASTPIYNWPTPDNTDLVKNGALAIRTLGDAIDTTVDTMIPETIFAAKGDLLGASANDTPAVLTVGANGETLVADSSATTGLRYVATPSASNPVINSGFNVWQRGTTISLGASTTAANGFLADRWQTTTSSGQASTITRQATGDTTNLPFIQYALRYQRNSGQTGTALSGFYQSFETVNSIPFVGKTITLSFYARSGADFSPTSDAIAARVYSGTGTDQSIFSYTGSASVINETKNLTATWQRFTVTSAAPVATTSTELAVGFEWTPVGTAGAADYFEITGVQIDVGATALPYRAYAATFQGELAACQRYFYKWVEGMGSGQGVSMGIGANYSATQANLSCVFPVTMRTNPTLVATTGSAYYKFERNGAQDDFNSLTIFHSGVSQATLYNASEISGTAGQAGSVSTQNNSASVAFSAEL
jgi:hypothetical protein